MYTPDIASQCTYARKFGRLFPHLDAWTTDEQMPSDYLKTISDEQDFLFQSFNDSSGIPAGYTYLGQFIAHDLSLDPSSTHETLADNEPIWNYRSQALDLDALYGGGPWGSPFLYDHDYKFVLERIWEPSYKQPPFYDIPRYNGKAIIADKRNDENLLISQLHLAFMCFHNKMIDRCKGKFMGEKVFFEARRLTIWHYQYVVVHDYLKQILGIKVWNDALRLLQIGTYFGQKPFIPVEFASAVFRFGHSQVRETYLFNQYLPLTRPIGLPIEKPGPPPFFVNWQLFFGTGMEARLFPNLNKLTQTEIASIFYVHKYEKEDRCLIHANKISPIFSTTLKKMGPDERPINLVNQNLQRGLKHKLPAGQAIAEMLGCPPVDWTALKYFFISSVNGCSKFPSSLNPEWFQNNTPLYYYILAEAYQQRGGQQLGALGAHIVKEVIVGLLKSDPTSYINQKHNWVPKVKTHNGDWVEKIDFSMADLLEMAGVFHGALVKDNSNSPQT